MTSQRHSSSKRHSASNRHSGDAILDAARDCVLAVGVRRTTLTDVARRAGVSRMTLYRRYPDVAGLVGDLLTREFGALVAAQTAVATREATGRARAVARLVAGTRALRDHPVMRKVLEVDPELLLPYLVVRLGGTQRIALEFFAADLAAGQQDGSIRPGDPAVLARAVLLVVQSFVFSLGTVDTDPELLYAELTTLLDAYLRPA
jgi:AcrR family transcriptional regulator